MTDAYLHHRRLNPARPAIVAAEAGIPTPRGLQGRASALEALLPPMARAMAILQAATAGIAAIAELVQSAKAIAEAALGVAGDTARARLTAQLAQVLHDIDVLAAGAEAHGVNLLAGGHLEVTFSEDGSSALTLRGIDARAAGLGLRAATGTRLADATAIHTVMGALDEALVLLRNLAATFGVNLTVVMIRQDFTRNLVATLRTGAERLAPSDFDQEAANMLALRGRRRAATAGQPLAHHADRAVLRLFG
jgi:flagellin-like hook-associated protein FlgL